MAKRIALVAVFAVILGSVAVVPLQAASGSSLWDWYLIPAAANLPGDLGTFWQTDVSIVNPYQWRSITIYIRYLVENQDNTNASEMSFSIPAGQGLRITDIVGGTFKATGKGALEVYTKDDAFFSVSARTYTGTSKTYGQTENGQKMVHRGGATAYITGLEESAGFRSNIGVVNASGVSISIDVSVYANNGTFMGSTTLELEPWSMTQVSVSSFAGSFASGYARLQCLTTTSRLQWVAYASIVDNGSGDGAFNEARVDYEYTSLQPAHDLSGWWSGTADGPAGYLSVLALLVQDGAEIDAWIFNGDGYLELSMSGTENNSQITIMGGYSWVAQCWYDYVSSGSATTNGSSISGTYQIYGDCLNGTTTFTLFPTNSPVKTGIDVERLPRRESGQGPVLGNMNR